MARKQTVSEKVVELFSTVDVKYGEELLGIARAILRQRGRFFGSAVLRRRGSCARRLRRKLAVSRSRP